MNRVTMRIMVFLGGKLNTCCLYSLSCCCLFFIIFVHHTFLVPQAICVKDISPNLKSCELLRDGTGTFQCKADVFLTLDSLDCLSA